MTTEPMRGTRKSKSKFLVLSKFNDFKFSITDAFKNLE